ncbi:hypothetical protein [Shewanella septentrionalis]|uniref:Uncharacterized protein n=1 Tax=Shewanella septentrionalis TaxID=2952223 RepID=A0A9X2WRL8_9GAMM|nr:hypothetical protein [Shewanella septentrionalis]MCT7944078.1 hypothetical protein [Shewanella septentrionalis]
MEQVYSTKSGTVINAADFSNLSTELQQTYKASLHCIGCEDVAWFRSATKPNAKVARAAHFNSHHHQGECPYRTSYLVIDDGSDTGNSVDVPVPTVSDYVINLDDNRGGAIADIDLPPIPPAGFVTPKGGSIGIGTDKAYEATVTRTLRQILSYLKRYPDFKFSDKRVEIYSDSGQLKIQGTIRDVAVHFDDITPAVDDSQSRLFWGLIVDSYDEAYGGIWLNASDSKSGLSVKVFADIRDKFLEVFKIEDLEELRGTHILLVGKLHYTGKYNKPVIFCPFVNLVTLQKYRERNI